MQVSTITPSPIPLTAPALGHSKPPSLGSFNTETKSLPPPSLDAPLDSNVSTPSSTTSASSESSDALPPTPPPAASFTSTTEASTSTRPPPRPTSSSTLTLTFSAHTSIPESVCLNPRVTAHPFSFPYHASATRDYTKPGANNQKTSPKRTTATTSGAEELEEDAWFFFSANHVSSGLTDVSNTGGEEGSDSLLLFRERQRRYYWLKQVREAQRRKKRKLEEEAEASDSTITEGTAGRRSTKKTKMDSSDARQRVRDVDGDVEMSGTPPLVGGGRVYSRTLSLRSPSPSSSTSSSWDYGGDRRERSSGKGSATAAFWGGIGGVGSGTRGVTPAPTSGSSSKPGTSSGAVSGPGPRTLASGGEGNRFTGSGGIGKGTGQAHTPWSSGNMVDDDEEKRQGTPPTHAPRSATPTIQVNGLTVVKTTSAMSGTARPRGLWRSSLRASEPVPAVSSPPAQVQGKTRIGGFVFGDNFLGPSLHHQQAGKHPTAASIAASSGNPTELQAKRASRRRPKFDRIPERLEGEDGDDIGGRKRPRSLSVSSCSSSSSSRSSSNCASAGESDGESEVEGRVEHRPSRSSSATTSYRSSSHGQTPRPQGTRSQGQNTTAPTKTFDDLGREPGGSGGLARYSESTRGSTTPTLGGLPVRELEEAPGRGKRVREKRSARGVIRGTSDDEGDDEADISDDLDKKRKQRPQANSQHKRQRTTMSGGTSATHAAASTSASSTPFSTSRHKLALTSTGVQHGEAGPEGSKGAKYVTRSKVMDTTSLAGVDPAVMASRKEDADPPTMVDSSTSTDASPPHMARPPSPSEYPFPSMHPVHDQPRKPLVTLEDWEDLKEVWNRCLEMVDAEEPEDVLPLLRGIIHECSWFLHEFEEPSVVFMAPRQVTTPTSPLAHKPESDVDMSGDSTPPYSAIRPLAHKGPGSTSSSRGGSHPRHRHHHLCQHHENNRHRPNTNDLPTAFHSLLGTALFLFGNIIGANPDLVMDGEPRTSTVYHLYALDVFEVGESLPSKTLVGRHNTVPGPLSQGHGLAGYSSGGDVVLPFTGLPSPECCAQGMKEDWQMAVTWGRALVSLAEDLLERQKIVEERNEALAEHAATNPGAAYQLHQQPFENPAAFLSEDFCIPTFMRGGGYFGGTGGEAMGLTLNGSGAFVPVGTGVGGVLSAFHSPALMASNPGSGDNHWSPGSSPLTRSDSTRTASSSSTTRMSTYASSSSGSSTTTISSVTNTPVPLAAPRLPAFADSQQQPQSMYPSSSFLSPSFIASSSRDTFGSSRAQTPSSTPTESLRTPGGYTDPRRLWQEESPFVVIRSRMPPVTRRMSLGVGAGASVDEMMTLAVDQFSRGIFHMPRAVLAGEGNEDMAREGSGLRGVGRHRKHQHHHHHGHGHHHTHQDEHGPGASTPTIAGVPSSFSRASHLYTIAVQVMLLAEKLSNPESRYKWGKYADSVFGQLKLEESPNVEVVSVASESFAGALNYGVGEAPMEVEDGHSMDVDEDGNRGREEARSDQHHHHHRQGHHHRHKHGHHHHHATDTGEGSGGLTQPSSTHAQPHFLNNNSNPDIMKARGRCALIIGGALAEESVEGPLEEVLSSFNEGVDGGNSGEMDKATEERVRQILESEDAVEARERLEEAVKLLERAREVWRRDVWVPRRKARESAKRKRGRARERERQEQELREKEREERGEKERLQREKAERAQRETPKTKVKDSKLGKVKRRGIGKIAADNKRAATVATSPPSSSASLSFPPSVKGKERATPVMLFPTPSELNTPENEVISTMRALQSPNTEVPPASPEPSGSEAAATSPPVMTDYFTPTLVPATSAPDTFNTNTHDEEEEAEKVLAAQEEEEEEMEEVDLASLLAEALVMLAELQVEKESKESMYRRAREEAGRAGKAGLVEEELGEGMNVDS